MNAPLDHFLESLAIGEPAAIGPVTLLPLRSSRGAPDLPVALLDDDSARVGEVSRGGVVGRIRVESLTPLPLLLLAGELLQGARQNRQVNATLLIPPGEELEVPVSCVEQGRWAYRSGGPDFRSTQSTLPWNMRSRGVARSLRAKLRRGRHDAGQGQVWREVDAHLRRKQARSATRDLLAGLSAELEQQAAAWTPGENDLGGAFFVGEQLVGLEAFGSPAAWKAAAPRVLAGLFEEASGVAPPAAGSVGEERVSELVETLRKLELSATPGEGLGEELQGESGETHLAALVASLEPGAEAVTVHLRASVLPTSTEPAHRPEDGLGVDSPRSFGGRQRQRLERLHRLRSALLRPTVAVGGPCLVVCMRAYERLQRRLRLPRGLPLPHRTGAGLVIWRNPSLYPLLELADILKELGVAEQRLWSWNGDRERLAELPDFLEVVSATRTRIELRRKDA